jgi:hypothetical protein
VGSDHKTVEARKQERELFFWTAHKTLKLICWTAMTVYFLVCLAQGELAGTRTLLELATQIGETV